MTRHPLPFLAGFELRPVTRDDVDAWYAYLALPETTLNMSFRVRDRRELAAHIDRLGRPERGEDIRIAVRRTGSPSLLGTVGVLNIALAHRRAEIAYDFAPAEWGHGLATRVVGAVAEWAIDWLALYRLEAVVVDSNGASMRVLEKCGFAREGLLHAYKVIEGQPRDYWMLSRTRGSD